MIQEVLLALSGFPSPILDEAITDGAHLVTNAEAFLLRKTSRLASLHRKIKDVYKSIASNHESAICRAVATSIISVHLLRFQQAIVEIEKAVLTKEAATVAADNVVPLARIVSYFEPFTRAFEWLSALADFTLRENPKIRIGIDVLEKLRNDSLTGFADVASIALDLVRVAERAWIKQLSQWIALGSLSKSSKDFFIRELPGQATFDVEDALVPAFVTVEAAKGVLVVGKTKQWLATSSAKVVTPLNARASTVVTWDHLKLFDQIQSPISTASFSSIISTIQHSLSVDVSNNTLSSASLVDILKVSNQFLLCSQPGFADQIILEADRFVHKRFNRPLLSARGSSISIPSKYDTDLVLSNAWNSVASQLTSDGLQARTLDLAQKLIILKPPPTIPSPFSHLLMSTPMIMTMQLDAKFELYISEENLRQYSTINAYIIAIRRAHNRLADMWRVSSTRKQRLTGLNSSEAGGSVLATILRRYWPLVSTTMSLLARLGAYLSDEVITLSWQQFLQWGTRRQTPSRNTPFNESTSPTADENDKFLADPEALVAGHCEYLCMLERMLMLDDDSYISSLLSVLEQIDPLCALIKELNDIQITTPELQIINSLDSLRHEGLMVHARTLEKASKRFTAATGALVQSLRTRSHKRSVAGTSRFDTSFRPFQDFGGIARLLAQLGLDDHAQAV